MRPYNEASLVSIYLFGNFCQRKFNFCHGGDIVSLTTAIIDLLLNNDEEVIILR